jgi:hypothetical protein
MDNLDKIQRLADEFGPELEALGERTDDLDDRVDAIEKWLEENAGFEPTTKKTKLSAEVSVIHGLQSDIDAVSHDDYPSERTSHGSDADPEELDLGDDDFGVGSFKLIVDHQDKDLTARVTYWEDTNNNPFHGRMGNHHGIDEAWISTEGAGGTWTVGNQYPGGYKSALKGGAVGPTGLLYYSPVAELGIQYQTDLSGIDLLGYVGNEGSSNKADGRAVVRGSIDLSSNLCVGVTYLGTGVRDEDGWGVDAEFDVMGRKIQAELAELTNNGSGNDPGDENQAWLVRSRYFQLWLPEHRGKLR